MGLLDRLAPRRTEVETARPAAAPADASIFATKALRKFLSTLAARESPVLLDLGPVVGANVTFFGEQLGCKILVEDIYADLERHLTGGKLDELPDFLGKRFTHDEGSVDGVLCWDLIDYLDRRSAQALAGQLTRLLRPDGALLAFFGTAQVRHMHYTKYVVVDQVNLRHRAYPATRGRQANLVNRDILRLFSSLRVTDSFLLQNNLREILFRKPVPAPAGTDADQS